MIDAEEIRAHGWTTLAEALVSLPGLYTSYDRSYTYLGTRGALRPGDYVSGFLLLIDGIRINDPIYGQAAIGSDFPVDLAMVERIEYAPGPGSAAFGSNAYFGVINVVTRQPLRAREAQLVGAVGSAGERRVSAMLAGNNGDDRLLVSAGHWRRAGRDLYFPEFDLPGSHDGIARGLDGERGNQLLLTSHWRGWDFTALHGRREKDVPTASFDQVFAVPGSFVVDQRSMARAGYWHELDADTRIGGDLVYGSYRYWGDYLFDDDGAVLRTRDGSSSRWLHGTWKLVSSALDRHVLATGIDFQHDLQRRQYNHAIDREQVHLDERNRGRRIGLFVSDEFELRPGLWLNSGLRYDYSSETGGRLSPRLALIGERDRTGFKLIAGQAFRSPNAYELYYEDGEDEGQLANPDLRAEYIRTFEFSLGRRLDAHTRVNGALYRYQLYDLISQVVDEPTGRLQFFNVDRARSTGGEIAIEHRRESGLRLRAGYGYTWLDGGDGGTLFSAPRHLGNLGISAPMFDGRVLAGVSLRHVHTRDGLIEQVSSYTVADVNLVLSRLPGGLEASLRIGNLFDRRYADPVGPEFRQNAIEQDRRSIRFGIGYRY